MHYVISNNLVASQLTVGAIQKRVSDRTGEYANSLKPKNANILITALVKGSRLHVPSSAEKAGELKERLKQIVVAVATMGPKLLKTTMSDLVSA
jgi:hypothetical protein